MKSNKFLQKQWQSASDYSVPVAMFQCSQQFTELTWRTNRNATFLKIECSFVHIAKRKKYGVDNVPKTGKRKKNML